MEIKKLSEELQIGELFITKFFRDDDEDMTIQEKDGTILFDGTREQALQLYEVFKEILNG